eukprot:951786-Amphidinium_carterae.1
MASLSSCCESFGQSVDTLALNGLLSITNGCCTLPALEFSSPCSKLVAVSQSRSQSSAMTWMGFARLPCCESHFPVDAIKSAPRGMQ